jgi:hypothetical protein
MALIDAIPPYRGPHCASILPEAQQAMLSPRPFRRVYVQRAAFLGHFTSRFLATGATFIHC